MLIFPSKKRIIDFGISLVIWVLLFIIVILGWKKLLQNHFKGQQLEDLSYVSNVVTYILFTGMTIRLIINIIWLIIIKEDLIFKIFKELRYYAFKGMTFLAVVSLLPIIKMAFTTIYSFITYCDYYHYFDARMNTDSFLQYFMNKKKGTDFCVECTKTSVNNGYPCNQVCFFHPYRAVLIYHVMFESPHISFSDFYEMYLPSMLLSDIFYLSVFVVIYLLIYKLNLDVLVNLPGPTRNIECKFQTLINSIKSAPLNIFRSYRYKYALYNFKFTGIKLFLVFWIYCFMWSFLDFYILSPFAFSCASFIIAISQIFTLPYISILHNIVNFVSYCGTGIISFLIALQINYIIDLPSKTLIIAIILLIIIPILTVIITPFFAKKDPLLAPTNFDLLKIERWEKKLNKLLHFRREKSKALKDKKKKSKSDDENNENFNEDDILFNDEPSIIISYYQDRNNSDNENDNINLIGQFDLIRLAPIQIQETINNVKYKKDGNIDDAYQNFIDEVHRVWLKIDVYEDDFNKATNEMIESSNKIFDCFSYNNIIRLFNICIIFSSALFGWIISSGIINWMNIIGPNGSNYYLRCNMFPNGTYPEYGSY